MTLFSVLAAVSSLTATAVATSQIVPVTEDSGFWFGNFTVGNSTNLSLLVDTGSGDIIVNPGLYKAGPNADNLHENFDNSYGTTQSNGGGTIDIKGPLYADIVSIGNLSAKQHIGAANNDTGIPHDGIVGFGPASTEFPGRNATAFVETLCRDGDLSECRFGLALNSNKTGSLILGETEPSLYKNDLSVVPSSESWTVSADIYVDGSISHSDISVLLDSGTATIVGPIDQVSAIFNSTGIQGVRSGGSLFGYFPCDKPPTLGLGLPSQSDAAAAAKNHSSLLSNTTTVFNISSDQWAIANNGNNNCTALLSGQDFGGESIWIFGQAFYTGLYVDHNMKDAVMGFASLATSLASPLPRSTDATATTSPASSPSQTNAAHDGIAMKVKRAAGLGAVTTILTGALLD